VPGRQFGDRQETGPFAAWSHIHRFTPDGDGTMLEDEIEYRLPLGAVGRALGGGLAERTLGRTFAFRHRRLANDLRRHASGPASQRVAVTGSHGLIGRNLCAFLTTGGHEVVPIVRQTPGRDEIGWNPSADRIDRQRLEGLDSVVHLAGEPVGRRWTPERRREIRESRIRGTRLLSETLAGLERKPAVFVSASAVGFYGADRGAELCHENCGPGEDFLAETCQQWEVATRPALDAGIRVVNLRIGVVLEALLPRLLPIFRAGVGGRLGHGQQWVSWIALDDVLGAILHAIDNEELAGPVNAVAPEPVTNAELTSSLADMLSRPAVLPVPAAAVRLLYGEMADAVLLGGQHVVPARLRETEFRFDFETLTDALGHVLGRQQAASSPHPVR
jgi:uncharacterized protein (TIGR01777 family)